MAELIPYKKIILERSDRGESFAVKQRFSERITREGLEGVQARLDSEGNTTLYVDPKYLKSEGIEHLIEHTLEGLGRDIKSKTTTIQVSELLFSEQKPEPKANGTSTERQRYEKLQESYKVAQAQLADLRDKLKESNLTYAATRDEKESLEKERKALERRLAEAEQIIKSQKTASSISHENPESLEAVLENNQKSFTSMQESLIAKVFYLVADSIEKGYTPKQQQEIEEAKKALAEKAAFYEAGGEATLKYLPEAARNAALKSAKEAWTQAEKILTQYASLEETQVPHFPVRLARRINAEIILLPLYPESVSITGKKIHESVEQLMEKIREMRVTINYIPGYQFTAVQIEGRMDESALKTLITESFSLPEYKISPAIFETRYLGDIPRKEELSEPKVQENEFSEFVEARIRELGHKTTKEFVARSGCQLALNTVYNIIKQGGMKAEKPSLEKLAAALQVPVEELENKRRF